MYFRQRFIPGLAIASYIVGDQKSGRAAVVDPTRDVSWYIEAAQRQGLRITDVLETHVHADYVSGARELKARLTGDGVTIHCLGAGGDAWVPRYADRVVADGDEVVLGDVRLRALHTPGHRQRLESEGDDRPVVLDVCTAGEWGTGHIDGALHIHTGDLSKQFDAVPADRPVAVVCGSGERASIAASLLKRAGRQRVLNVLGGMTAWHAVGLPTVQPAAKVAA